MDAGLALMTPTKRSAANSQLRHPQDKGLEGTGAHCPTGARGPGRTAGAGRSRRAAGRRPPQPERDAPLVPQAVVGDSEYHHFRHRIPPARVRLLEVGGDLQLESVKVF